MNGVMELFQQPLLMFAAAFLSLWLASFTGVWLHRRYLSAEDEQHEDLGIILGASLTLLALIIGFQRFHGQHPIRSAQES